MFAICPGQVLLPVISVGKRYVHVYVVSSCHAMPWFYAF